MRHNPDFVLSDVAGSHVLMPAGKAAEMYGMVTLNDVGAAIWNALEEDVTFEQVLEAVMDRYEIDRETAEPDLVRFLEKLRSFNGLLE
jgi:hypothetical protein